MRTVVCRLAIAIITGSAHKVWANSLICNGGSRQDPLQPVALASSSVMRRAMLFVLSVPVLTLLPVSALAQEKKGDAKKDLEKRHQQFGEVHFPVACKAGVQEKFDLAVAMLHTFSFPAAAKTFTAISQEDPECAMAYWGRAATSIGSLYAGRPGPTELQGKRAVEKAKAIGGKTPREREYIAAVEALSTDA